MQSLFDWLTSLPPAALYVALAVTAALENFFPPLPADTVVAFGSFLAARGRATAIGTLLATWLGNVAGATAVYAIGRRFGAAELSVRLRRYGGQSAEEHLRRLYGRYGTLALFLSRFLPGIRALVPPFAGALEVPASVVIAAMGLASLIWYGVVTLVAYRVGANWELLRARITSLSLAAAAVAGIVILVLLVWWVLRKRRREGA